VPTASTPPSTQYLGRVLYRKPPDTRGGRGLLLSATFSLPWLLLAYFQPEMRTYLLAVGGTALAAAIGFALDYLFGLKEHDTIHERGALLNIDGGRQVLWFSSDILVTEIHEIMRDYGEPEDDQWVFELRTGSGTFSLSTYVPCAADHIREALTRALGQPPRLIERR
jgi:hypothetical protein